MNVRTIAAFALATTAASLALTATPAFAAQVNDVPTSFSTSIVDAAGTVRGSLNADAGVFSVCDSLSDGVAVAAEATLSDGTTLRRVAPVGGCSTAPSGGPKIIFVRGFAGDFANPQHQIR